MAGQRGSDREVTVIGSCGHKKGAHVHGSRGGPVSRRNVIKAQTTPCYDCRVADEPQSRGPAR
ncbi:hypothetical protein CMI37_14560 [Candidatus Pacearchaeota archaeon]|nr:hypothetical protein [Candidatus Pacearchaeota archaeon]